MRLALRAKLFFVLFGLAVISVTVADLYLDVAVSDLHRFLLWCLLILISVMTLVFIVGADRLFHDLRSFTEAAGKMAEGELKVRTRSNRQDEMGLLGRALDQLAANLATTIADLKADRDLLGGIINAMQEGLLVIDSDNRIEVVNPALREMLLFGPDVIGKYVLDVIRHAEFQELISQVRRSGTALLREMEWVGLKPRHLLVHAALLRPPQDLLAVFVDVTELRRLERVRTDFVANVSHELRTPVTAIRGYAETLKAGALSNPDVAMNMVTIIFQQAERLSRLLEDLLELARLEGKELKLAEEPVVLHDAVSHATDAVRQKADSKGIKLNVHVPKHLLATGDGRAIEQVLLNLLDNAIKYIPSKGTVEVKAYESSGQCSIEVRDSGMGIEERHLPRLFERFYRVDQGRSREQGGTGLGLSIVKHLVSAMRGQVTVESQLGVGSVFRVVLPQAAPRPVLKVGRSQSN